MNPFYLLCLNYYLAHRSLGFVAHRTTASVATDDRRAASDALTIRLAEQGVA